MKHLVLALLLVSLPPMSIQAQEVDFMKMIRSQRNRQYHKDVDRESYRALWNGNGAVVSAIPLWQNEDFRRELELTPEQHAGLDFLYSKDGSMGHWYRAKAETDPVLAQMLAEHETLNTEMRKDPYGEKTDPETERVYLDQLRNMTAYYFVESQKDVENMLTPEQMQKVRESELALMSEIPILNPSMFQSLNMTDEQKKQMEAIKKELEPEFEKIVDELVDLQDKIQQQKFEMFEKFGIKFDKNGNIVDEEGKPLDADSEKSKKKKESMEAELAKNEKLQAEIKRINERASGFMNGFKLKMLDVLTDDQLAKMQSIIDNPTEYVKKIRDRMRKEREARAEEAAWKPGIDSWRPGDPVPKEYLEQRKQRKSFPSAEPDATKP